MYSALITLLLLGAPLAHSTATCQPFTDKFEDVGNDLPVPQANDVGIYHDINYKGWVVASRSPVTGTVGGLQPASGDRVAAVTMLGDLLQTGQLAFKPFGLLDRSDIIKSFDLSSFYFGCSIATQQTVFQTNQGCVISATPYYAADGTQGPARTYRFSSGNALNAPMQLVNLPDSFKKLSSVRLQIEDVDFSLVPDIGATQAILRIDDVHHCNYA